MAHFRLVQMMGRRWGMAPMAAMLLFLSAQWHCCGGGLVREHGPAAPPLRVGKPLPSRIMSLAMVGNGTDLLALSRDALLVIDPESLAVRRTIEIKQKGTTPASLWSAGTMAVSPDGTHVLVLDRYIHLATGKPVATLAVASAIRAGLPNPEAMDISPDGKVGLVLVSSYLGGKYDKLALFDLKTGKLIRVCGVGESVAHAAFAGADRLLVFHDDHRVTILGLDGKTLATLTKDGPRPLPSCGPVVIAGSGKDRIVAAYGSTKDGRWQAGAFRPAREKILFRTNAAGGGVAATGSGWMLYQTTRLSKKLCECGQHPLFDLLLKARSTSSGLTREMPMPKQFGLMVLDARQNVLLCAQHNGNMVTVVALPDGFLRDKPGTGQAKPSAPIPARKAPR